MHQYDQQEILGNLKKLKFLHGSTRRRIEEKIKDNAKFSCWYIAYVLDWQPFPLAEPIIAKYPGHAAWYAKNVLHGLFPMGEAAIATDFECARYYYTHIILPGYKGSLVELGRLINEWRMAHGGVRV